MGTTAALGGFLVAVAFIAGGLVMVGFGQVFGALKEIALNTRTMAFGHNPAAAPEQTPYTGLGFISTAMSMVGALTSIVGGVVLVVVALK